MGVDLFLVIVRVAISLDSLRSLADSENCSEGQHIAGISNAASVNRVYFWQGVVALCESFPNVNPVLVIYQAEPRISTVLT